jgi:carbon-monoxide dehydrogenase large subunit
MAGGLSPLNQLMLTGRYQPLAHADLEETMSQIGARRPRVEDERLVTGLGRYAADVRPPGLCHLAVLRSPLPHARIRRLDVEPARSLPGVLAVWTAGDLGSVGLPEGFPPLPPLERVHRQPLLAAGETCHQGEALAVVVALTPEVAADAVERIELELDPLPAVGGADVALAGPPVHEGDPANSAGRLVIEFGDVEAAFTGAPVRVAATLRAARICGAAMEPRAVTAIPEGDGLVVHASTQSVFAVRQAVADALGLASEQVRVLAEDVGGGFGAKGEPFPEEVLVAHAARRLGRPVRWVATRSEDGATTSQSHGSVLELELAAESDGRLRGLRGRFLHDLGAFAGSGTGQGGNAVMHMVSVYRLPALRIELVPIYTCEARTGFIRGGGREIGNFAIERMVDLLADRLGMDRAAIRERNLLRPDQMPYDTGFRMGEVPVRYDLGDVPAMLARIRELVRDLPLGPDGSVTRGIGIACYAESTGFGQGEPARVRVGRDGIATVQVGSTPQGQGHQTMVTQVVADRLGWRPERIRVRAGDTQGLPFALLTAGSRSAVHVGNAAAMAARAARRRLLELAAARLEADPEDARPQPRGRRACPRRRAGGGGALQHRPAYHMGQRLPRGRGRGRPGDPAGGRGPLPDRPRLRSDDQPRAGRGPDPRRARPRHRLCTLRGRALRPGRHLPGSQLPRLQHCLGAGDAGGPVAGPLRRNQPGQPRGGAGRGRGRDHPGTGRDLLGG